MVEQFEIELSKYQFNAGETVYGTIFLQANQTVKVSQFYAIIKGEGRVIKKIIGQNFSIFLTKLFMKKI